MGIRFQCPNCQGRLHVKAFLAGKQGVCPKCRGPVLIPHEDEGEQNSPAAGTAPDFPGFLPRCQTTLIAEPRRIVRPTGGAPSRTTPPVGETGTRTAKNAANPKPVPTQLRPTKGPADIPTTSAAAPEARASRPSVPSDGVLPWDEQPDAVWYVRPPSGGQYGPAQGSVLKRWVAEGRVSADAYVWREGWGDWRLAADVLPLAAASPPAVVPSPTAIAEPPVAHGTPMPQPAPSPVSVPAAAPVAVSPVASPVSIAPAPSAAGTDAMDATGGRTALAIAAEQRYLRRRRSRQGLWTMAVVTLTVTAIGLLAVLIYVLQNGS